MGAYLKNCRPLWKYIVWRCGGLLFFFPFTLGRFWVLGRGDCGEYVRFRGLESPIDTLLWFFCFAPLFLSFHFLPHGANVYSSFLAWVDPLLCFASTNDNVSDTSLATGLFRWLIDSNLMNDRVNQLNQLICNNSSGYHTWERETSFNTVNGTNISVVKKFTFKILFSLMTC